MYYVFLGPAKLAGANAVARWAQGYAMTGLNDVLVIAAVYVLGVITGIITVVCLTPPPMTDQELTDQTRRLLAEEAARYHRVKRDE